MVPLDLEHVPAAYGDPAGDSTDPFAELAASRKRLTAQATEEFPGPLSSLIIRYRRLDIDTYREASAEPDEWQRWAQLLIDACDGFRKADKKDDLLDDLGTPLQWDTLAQKIGVELDPERGTRGLVLDVFGGPDFEMAMITHAQAVDRWMTTEVRDLQGELKKGS